MSARVDACPDGSCDEAAALETRFASLEADRSALHATRAELGPCMSCQALDATIRAVDGLAASVTARLGTWNEQT